MTADTLSAEERKALFARCSTWATALSFGHGLEAIDDIAALLRLAKLATPELLALGEAAVKYAEADEDGWDLNMLADKARAYAASVRPMTGFIASLTPEQREAALAYRGDDTIGSGDQIPSIELGDDRT